MIKCSICKVGLEGEERLRTYLRNILTDEYTALYNVPVEHGDTDCIIIGPKRLYAIEAKHHRGSIIYTDNTWRQIKIGRKGSTYTGELKNPSGQLMQNIRWLKEISFKQGYHDLDQRAYRLHPSGSRAFHRRPESDQGRKAGKPKRDFP